MISKFLSRVGLKAKEKSVFDSSIKEVVRAKEVNFHCFRANRTKEYRNELKQAMKACNAHIRWTKFLHDLKLKQNILQKWRIRVENF